MKTKIIAITGLSGTGKTTLARMVSDITKLPFIITVTTRPIRPNEKDGIDYWFYTREVYNIMNEKESIIAGEDFRVASGDIWSYGIRKEDLESHKTVIMVLSPKGVKDLRKLGYDVLSIYIKVNEDIRLDRIGARKDNQSQAEIKRRSREDAEKFASYTPDYIIYNNNDVKDAINQIMDIINKRDAL